MIMGKFFHAIFSPLSPSPSDFSHFTSHESWNLFLQLFTILLLLRACARAEEKELVRVSLQPRASWIFFPPRWRSPINPAYLFPLTMTPSRLTPGTGGNGMDEPRNQRAVREGKEIPG
jgi:hypothetical protein